MSDMKYKNMSRRIVLWASLSHAMVGSMKSMELFARWITKGDLDISIFMIMSVVNLVICYAITSMIDIVTYLDYIGKQGVVEYGATKLAEVTAVFLLTGSVIYCTHLARTWSKLAVLYIFILLVINYAYERVQAKHYNQEDD